MGSVVDTKGLILAAAVMFSGKTLREVEFKYSAFKILMSSNVGDPDDGTIDYYQIIDAVEPIAGFWGEDRIRSVIDEMGILERVEDSSDLYVRKSKFNLEDIVGEIYRGAPTEVDADFLDELEEGASSRSNLTRHDLLGVLKLSHGNALKILEASRGGLPSPFFSHKDGRDLRPFTPNRSLTAVFDQISLFVELPDFVPALKTELTSEQSEIIKSALSVAIDTQLPASDYFGDGGGLALIGSDEDYPGSDRPVVPSNALFLICTRLVKIFYPSIFSEEFEIAASSTVDFILRHQLPDGMWGAHSYPVGTFGAEHIRSGNLFFSSISVTALKLWENNLDGTRRGQCREALRRTAKGVMTNGIVHGDSTNHAFDDQNDGESAATAHAVSLLLSTLEFVDEPTKEKMIEKIQHCIEWIASNWTVAKDESKNVDLIRFRPPTTRGPADTFMTWEQPGHAHVLSVLSIASARSEINFPEACWGKMEIACQMIAQRSVGGYWMDIGLKDKIQVSNSATCSLAIAKYLAATRNIDAGD